MRLRARAQRRRHRAAVASRPAARPACAPRTDRSARRARLLAFVPVPGRLARWRRRLLGPARRTGAPCGSSATASSARPARQIARRPLHPQLDRRLDLPSRRPLRDPLLLGSPDADGAAARCSSEASRRAGGGSSADSCADDRLYIALLEVESAPPQGALAVPFRVTGTSMAEIRDFTRDPRTWQPRVTAALERRGRVRARRAGGAWRPSVSLRDISTAALPARVSWRGCRSPPSTPRPRICRLRSRRSARTGAGCPACNPMLRRS